VPPGVEVVVERLMAVPMRWALIRVPMAVHHCLPPMRAITLSNTCILYMWNDYC